MRFVRKLYEVRGWTPMKTEYSKKNKILDLPSEEELQAFIEGNGHSIWRKIDQRLGYRQKYLDSGLSAKDFLESPDAPDRPNQ